MAGAADRLALEHLTAPSASPLQIVELAAAHGWRAATVLVAPFAPFPETAGIDLVGDPAARRAVRTAADRGGVTLALAYPFVLSPRTPAAALERNLEAAAQVGAVGAGLLVYAREPARAVEETAAFCGMAARYGVRPVLEVFGGSAAPDMAEADALWAAAGSEALGLCVDLLHLTRSGGGVEDIARAQAPLLHAQVCDAPRTPVEDRDAEASRGRSPPGDGELDVRGFVGALPASAWIGVEVPPRRASGASELDRAARVMARTASLLQTGP